MKFFKFIFFVVMAGIIAYWLLFTSEGSRLFSSEGRKVLVIRLDSLVVSFGWAGPIIFGIVYALGVLVLPVTPFTATGAFIFGQYFGFIINTLGATLGASISFYISRYFLRDFAKGFLTGKLDELDCKAGENGFSIIFYLRIIWFPFIVLNYAAGTTKICFADYFWGTFLGILPSILITTLFFGGIKEMVLDYNSFSDLVRFDIILPTALLILSFLIPFFVKRIREAHKLS